MCGPVCGCYGLGEPQLGNTPAKCIAPTHQAEQVALVLRGVGVRCTMRELQKLDGVAAVLLRGKGGVANFKQEAGGGLARAVWASRTAGRSARRRKAKVLGSSTAKSTPAA